MNDTTDLIAWMREQTGIDKTRAEAASSGRWVAGTDGLVWPPRPGDPVSGCTEPADGEHIATWDPPRVLAEVEAKRRIIDAYEMANWHVERDNEPSLITIAETWCEAVKLLATAYADRDGYQADAWKPWEPEL